MAVEIGRYKDIARRALKDKALQKALSAVQGRIGRATAQKYLELPEGPQLRKQAKALRMQALENLDIILQGLADGIRNRGGSVYFARDGRAAVDYCLALAAEKGVARVVKGKSMVSEEIGLNDALSETGIEVTETDLGEYIIQLAGERPSHIVAPAIHKGKEEIGRLFQEKLNIPYTEDPADLTKAARSALRKKFFEADMGITGCNLACAETGHITTVSNEGNIRMSSTMPMIHVAIMGMERAVAKLEHHDMLFRLLSRGAAAQNLAGYISYVGGPASYDHCDGPEEFHLIILDNHRSKILADEEFREILCCIRCGACLNVCPVYGKIGGYAYGHPYAGPIGTVLTPLMAGVDQARDLCFGETLCRACQDACPVDIDIPRMILALRQKCVQGDSSWRVKPASKRERLFFKLWSFIVQHRRFFDLSLKLAFGLQRLLPAKKSTVTRLLYPLEGWIKERDLPQPAGRSFIQRWKKRGLNRK